MKKVLFVLALGAFAACGSGETKDTTADSTKTDSVVAPVVVPAPVDSVKHDSVAPVAADSAATKK